MAEIEQRPEIKDAIQAAWDDKRRRDIDYVYNINSSAHFSDMSGPEFATFREHYGQLYNNPMLQRYINAIGQRLVPKDSPNIYSFKLLLDPIPKAEALSTGTILISTGMVSMLDNEAQLAYVLGHEIAHVEKNHAYTIVRMSVLEPALNAEKEKETKEKRAIVGAVGHLRDGGAGRHLRRIERRDRRRPRRTGGGDGRRQSDLPRPQYGHRMGATFTRTRRMRPRCTTCWTRATTCARPRAYTPACNRRRPTIRASDWGSWRRRPA